MHKSVLVAIFATVALVGCSTTPTTEAPVEDRGAAGAAGAGAGASTGGAGAGGVSGSQVGAGGANALRDPNSIMSRCCWGVSMRRLLGRASHSLPLNRCLLHESCILRRPCKAARAEQLVKFVNKDYQL